MSQHETWPGEGEGRRSKIRRTLATSCNCVLRTSTQRASSTSRRHRPPRRRGARHEARGWHCCLALQRRGRQPAARVGARRARQGGGSQRIRSPSWPCRARSSCLWARWRLRDAPLLLHRRPWLRDPRRDGALRVHRRRGGLRAPAGGARGRASRSLSACSRWTRWSRPRRGSTRAARPCGRRSRWLICSRSSGLRLRLPRPFRYHPASMSRVCAVCGKKPGFGNHRSHSMVATKRRFDPNPSAGSGALEGQGAACLRLHQVPQSRARSKRPSKPGPNAPLRGAAARDTAGACHRAVIRTNSSRTSARSRWRAASFRRPAVTNSAQRRHGAWHRTCPALPPQP